MEEIGDGSSSIVYKQDGIAVKKYHNEKSPDVDFDSEVECLKRMQNCPWVVQYISHDKDLGEIRMELLTGETRVLLKMEDRYPWITWIENFTIDVLEAEVSMYNKNIVHGDINYNNVLYYEDDSGTLHFKVCDFSHSTLLDENFNLTKPFALLGAPEWFVANYEPFNETKTRTWAIAHLVYYIVKHRFIVHELWRSSSYYIEDLKFYEDLHLEKLKEFIVDNRIDGQFCQIDIDDMIVDLDLSGIRNPESMKNFLYGALKINNGDRITVKEALEILRK